MLKIPYQELSKDTLENIIVEIVTRDGTDYGEYEISTSAKVKQVLNLLQSNKLFLSFDEETESCNLLEVV